jgi:hypothetical protein
MRWLAFLGKRRPATLEEHASYDEQVSRPPAQPVAHELPEHQAGTPLGDRGQHRKAGPGVGRHRREPK